MPRGHRISTEPPWVPCAASPYMEPKRLNNGFWREMDHCASDTFRMTNAEHFFFFRFSNSNVWWTFTTSFEVLTQNAAKRFHWGCALCGIDLSMSSVCCGVIAHVLDFCGQFSTQRMHLTQQAVMRTMKKQDSTASRSGNLTSRHAA